MNVLVVSSRRVNHNSHCLIGGVLWLLQGTTMKISEPSAKLSKLRDISNFELKRLADTYIISGMPEQTRSVRSRGTAVAAAIA